MWKPYEWEEAQPNPDKLIAFGFVKEQHEYVYAIPVRDGAFTFFVTMTEDGRIATRIEDRDSGEEYALAYDTNAVGAFVGSVRAECEAVMAKIWHTCYDFGARKGELALACERYVADKYRVEAEYLWDKYPTYAVFREPKGSKWFAVLMVIPRCKLGLEGEGEAEVINLKAPPDKVDELVDGKTIFGGYHMNKKHWITVLLDGRATRESLFALIDGSLACVTRKERVSVCSPKK